MRTSAPVLNQGAEDTVQKGTKEKEGRLREEAGGSTDTVEAALEVQDVHLERHQAEAVAARSGEGADTSKDEVRGRAAAGNEARACIPGHGQVAVSIRAGCAPQQSQQVQEKLKDTD